MELTRRALVAGSIGAAMIGSKAATASANDIDARFKAFLRQHGHVVDESSFVVRLNDTHHGIDIDYGCNPYPLTYEMVEWARGEPLAHVNYSANYDCLGRSTGQREFIKYTAGMWFIRGALDGLSESEFADVFNLPYEVRSKLLYDSFVLNAKRLSV